MILYGFTQATCDHKGNVSRYDQMVHWWFEVMDTKVTDESGRCDNNNPSLQSTKNQVECSTFVCKDFLSNTEENTINKLQYLKSKVMQFKQYLN